ncbi:MAG: hypothetical protein V4640_07210 [Verrucomicrobiota bacterium]
MKPLILLSLSALSALAQDGFSLGGEDGPLRLDLRPSVEAVVWSGDTPPPTLLGYDASTFFAPRFTLAVDAAAGEHWFFSATSRWDRGFDAEDGTGGEVRLDEIIVRWRVFDDARLNFQFGKFPTAFGAWSGQHDFFDDPFLSAPLPYSQIIGINTRNPSANTPAAIAARHQGSAPAFSTLSKDQWASVIWGPDYASGASAFGATEFLDYALEIKNSALSAHPDSWGGTDFSDPTLTGRFGFRPDAAWAFGLSASRGPWMEENAPGIERDDFMQNTLGLDARWAHHNLIVSGEAVLSEFETPAAGDLRTAAWYLQARWKVSPGFWLASRFGRITANESNGVPWQPDVWRAEIGTGWRLTSDLLIKAGYSYTTGDDDAGNHLVGTGIGWRF